LDFTFLAFFAAAGTPRFHDGTAGETARQEGIYETKGQRTSQERSWERPKEEEIIIICNHKIAPQ